MEVLKKEFYCTECNSTVDESDSICKNCGADLSELVYESKSNGIVDKILFQINKFSKYHRAGYYLFLAPLLMIVTSISFGIIYLIYNELFKSSVEKLQQNYVFDYFIYILAVLPYILPVFVFMYLYLKIEQRLRLILTTAIILITTIISFFLQILGYNTIGIIPINIILLELCYIKYSKKDYLIISLAIIILFAWVEFLSLGDLTKEIVVKDFKRITKSYDVNKSEIKLIKVLGPKTDYDRIVPYVLYTQKDTMQLIMNYNKVWTKAIPSQKWRLINWEIVPIKSEVIN